MDSVGTAIHEVVEALGLEELHIGSDVEIGGDEDIEEGGRVHVQKGGHMEVQDIDDDVDLEVGDDNSNSNEDNIDDDVELEVGEDNSNSNEEDIDNDVDLEVGEDNNSFNEEANGQADGEADVEVPQIGILFDSWEAIEVYYKKYAKSRGFGVSRGQSAYTLDKSKKRAMTWKCECWGDDELKLKWDSAKVGKTMEIGGTLATEMVQKSKRKSKKCGCRAMLYASLTGNGMWIIKKVTLDHSGHDPIPSQSKLVKEYRMQNLNNTLRRRILNDYDSGISVADIHASLAREQDGLENMPITEKDIRHIIDDRRRLKMKDGDAKALLNYFDRMKKDNKNFFHTCRLDNTGTLTDVFWADARSRVAYQEFGDVICFDSIYLTNKYELPFANFVGVNHHGQSILLGCALISHEDCETFEWLFNQWLTCMGAKEPDGILTDQAPAMRKPVADVFPNTRHRWCMWHILRKIPNKLGKHKKYEALKEALLQVIYDRGEFEEKWVGVIRKFKLRKNEWLQLLYTEREMWVPCYMNDQFWAGMRTTQRVESINSFFDKFVKRQTRLCEFGEKYIAAVERRIAQERDADEMGTKYIRSCVTGIALERYFQEVYTDAKFRALQRECERLIYCYYKEIKEVGPNKVEYVVEDRVWKTRKGGIHQFITPLRRYYTVEFETDLKHVKCNCRMFETTGILCKHCIRILDMNGVTQPAEKYVLRRWRKDIFRKHTLIKVAYHDPSKTTESRRFDNLSALFDPIGYEACYSDKTYEIVVSGLKSLQEQVHAEILRATATELEQNANHQPAHGVVDVEAVIGNGGEINETGQTTLPEVQGTHRGATDGGTQETQAHCVKDPPIPTKKKGRPKNSRNKSPGEPGWKKTPSKKAVHDGSDEDDVSVEPSQQDCPLSNNKKSKRKGPAVESDMDEVNTIPSEDLVGPATTMVWNFATGESTIVRKS